MADHPIVVTLGVLASIAAIIGLLITLGVIDVSDDGMTPAGSGTDSQDAERPEPPFFRCDDPSLSLSTGSGGSGTEVTVRGSGLAPDEEVDLRFHTEALVPARTDASGDFSADITIPGTFDAFAPRQFSLSATTTPTVCSADASFELTE